METNPGKTPILRDLEERVEKLEKTIEKMVIAVKNEDEWEIFGSPPEFIRVDDPPEFNELTGLNAKWVCGSGVIAKLGSSN